MREVSREEFFEPIMRDRLDLHPRIINDSYPYTSEYCWRTNPNKQPYGRVVGSIDGGIEVKHYFINN